MCQKKLFSISVDCLHTLSSRQCLPHLWLNSVQKRTISQFFSQNYFIKVSRKRKCAFKSGTVDMKPHQSDFMRSAVPLSYKLKPQMSRTGLLCVIIDFNWEGKRFQLLKYLLYSSNNIILVWISFLFLSGRESWLDLWNFRLPNFQGNYSLPEWRWHNLEYGVSIQPRNNSQWIKKISKKMKED